ncbi:hypothetical protein AAVH_06936 [Aphelenchoides avenae]|nr:hypothetical protein AAVH_06936 [Aphelenchus avenae]
MGNNYVLAVGIALGSQILSVALGQDLSTTAFPSGVTMGTTINWWNNQDITTSAPPGAFNATTIVGGIPPGISTTAQPLEQTTPPLVASDPSAATTLTTVLGIESTAGADLPPTTLAPDATTKGAVWHSSSAFFALALVVFVL